MSTSFWTEGPDALRKAHRENKESFFKGLEELIKLQTNEESRMELQRLREQMERDYDNLIEGTISQSLF